MPGCASTTPCTGATASTPGSSPATPTCSMSSTSRSRSRRIDSARSANATRAAVPPFRRSARCSPIGSCFATRRITPGCAASCTRRSRRASWHAAATASRRRSTPCSLPSPGAARWISSATLHFRCRRRSSRCSSARRPATSIGSRPGRIGSPPTSAARWTGATTLPKHGPVSPPWSTTSATCSAIASNHRARI